MTDGKQEATREERFERARAELVNLTKERGACPQDEARLRFLLGKLNDLVNGEGTDVPPHVLKPSLDRVGQTGTKA